MPFLLAIAIGVLYGTGIYMMMRKSVVKLILGLGLLGHGANLLIFTIGRINRANPPIIPTTEHALIGSFADPIPQALILTAIVIGFGLLAFVLVLLRQVTELMGTDDVEKLALADEEVSSP